MTPAASPATNEMSETRVVAHVEAVHVLLRNNASPRLQGRFERNGLTESFELSH